VRKLAALASIALAAAVLLGCAGKPPVISRVLARALYIEDLSTGSFSEALSVFLVVSDPDGIEDLSAFYVINDDAELFWKVESSAWIRSMAEGETWIGSSSLSMPGSDSLPTGNYRVNLQDMAGGTAEETVTLPERSVSAAQAAYPAASIKDGAITVTGPYENTEIWVYGKDGRYVASYPAGKKAALLDVKYISAASPALAQGFTFRVYAYVEKGGFGVLAGPYASENAQAR